MRKQVLTRLVNNTSNLLNTIVEDAKTRQFINYERFSCLDIKLSGQIQEISFEYKNKYIIANVDILMTKNTTGIYTRLLLYKIQDNELKQAFINEINGIARFLGFNVVKESEDILYLKYEIEV